MKNLVLTFALLLFVKVGVCQNQNAMEQTVYQFKVKDIEGNEFDFENLRGKKIMVVNTASKCGLTGQYRGLQNLYEKYKDLGFVIVGFPANDFMWQEPGSNEEIAEFCEKNYGVSFPMMSKIKVKGNGMHPLYQFLTKVEQNGYKSSSVSWNFQKYLIGRNGKLEKIITPRTAPMSEEVIEWVEGTVTAIN